MIVYFVQCLFIPRLHGFCSSCSATSITYYVVAKTQHEPSVCQATVQALYCGTPLYDSLPIQCISCQPKFLVII